MKNENIYNANILLTELSNNEIKTIVDVYNIMKSNEWNYAIFNQLKTILIEKNEKIIFKEKDYRSVEIYFEGYKFWIELYFYLEEKYFKLWVVNYSTEESNINPIISNLGFSHDSISKNRHYFINTSESMHIYEFPTNDKYEKLTNEILRILKVSI